ncbi:hypothetical protein WMY93_006666 [Mugilogobius chulae]|uniref:Centromere protein K n=1 Tax=Mugilogobius chulae TaxID=88201 RepID=A0AAW0PPA9_9GOBI
MDLLWVSDPSVAFVTSSKLAAGILKERRVRFSSTKIEQNTAEMMNVAQTSELSETAQGVMLNQCEEQYGLLEKLQNEIILCEPDCNENQDQSVNRLMATEAELKQWSTMEPSLLSKNSEVLLLAGKEEIIKLCSQLELSVLCYEAKRDKLKEFKKLEQKWLEEKKQMLEAVSDHVQRLQMEREKLSENSLYKDTKDKIQKIKLYQERLMESLGDILEKHVPPPPQTETKKKMNSAQDVEVELISLNEILELLMNKVLTTPHDPYVDIDATFWPPYVEMLLRYGIAIRHQENNFKIRLETFC